MIISNTILLYTLGGIGVLLLILMIWIAVLHRKIRRVLVGKNARTLEDSIVAITHNMSDLKRFTQEMEQYLQTVERRLKLSIQGVDTVRFNPFKGTGSGGNNSFSTAFINEKGEGVVLTSMYARDRISMFAKPIKAFASDFELSEEEIESIEKARTRLTS